VYSTSGHPTSGATDDGAPPSGSTDQVVVDYALRTNQIIVTQNHDMMTLCHEQDQRFVWVDPRGRHLTREQQVVLVFTQIRRWDEILADGRLCVRALRTTARAVTAAEAARLARERMRRIERRPRRSQPVIRALGGLVSGGADGDGAPTD
jgi:predicted nuclease of predicted toxin-antitoxin system